jgi:S1-C subfamily serine protease
MTQKPAPSPAAVGQAPAKPAVAAAKPAVPPAAKPAGTVPPATKPAAPLAPSDNAVGIGVQFVPEAHTLRVNMVIAGGGAAAAGIVVGDRVIGVDGVPVAKLGAEGAVAKILGTPGTTVAITLQRNNAPLTLNIERKKPKKKLSLDFGDMSEVLERKISP